MAMGKKKRRQQEDLWVATSELPRTAGHPFYESNQKWPLNWFELAGVSLPRAHLKHNP